MSPTRLPPNGSGSDDLCDWLELAAFFSEFGKSRVDEITGAIKTLEEESPNSIDDRDIFDDKMREAIEKEFNYRKKHLENAYPFEFSEDGEEFILSKNVQDPEAAFYLLCLIASHAAASAILAKPPSAELERSMRRRAFQVLGTLAMAGVTAGPAVSVGWPRESKETILEVVHRAAGWGIGMVPRAQPGELADPHDKDAGIDAISWRAAPGPPPDFIAFGQVASGNNWRGKPVTPDITPFMSAFFDYVPTNNNLSVTVIPHRVADERVYKAERARHGALLNRVRAPIKAIEGLRLSLEGVNMDEANNVGQIVDWLFAYRESAMTE